MSFLLNDVNNHDNFFSLEWRRDYFQAAFTRATFSKVPSQEFAMGGGVQRCETKLKQFIFGIGTFFCPKLGKESLHLDLVQFFAQSSVKTKKKVFVQVEIEFYDRILFKSRVKVVTFSLLMPMGGIFSLLVQKLVSKSNKNSVFCILCMPMGRPNPPPHMATLLLLAVRIGILPFNSSSIALVSFFIDLRKKKGEMSILAAKSRPCKCSFRYILLKAVAKGDPVGPRPFLEML